MSELARYDAARKALAEATRIDDVKSILDKSVAVRTYAKQRKDPELLIPAIDICKRAETRAGELLAEMARTGERVKGGDPKSRAATLAKLSDLGVTKTQSSRWQAFAALPVEIREAKIALAKKKALSAIDGSSKRTRAEMRVDDEARVAALAPVPGKFKTLIFDPPWDYEWLSVAGRAAPNYATMTHDELKSLDVAQWAEPDCHLYLWTTNNFMTRAVKLMALWGFEHKTILTWVKSRWGLGSYAFAELCEPALTASRRISRRRLVRIVKSLNSSMR